ncbi:MAG TPA: hypothetical protein PK566_18970 [Pseudobacteroides sp.]|nr:hypothetical protein [Pseudobacteroides sp.]
MNVDEKLYTYILENGIDFNKLTFTSDGTYVRYDTSDDDCEQVLFTGLTYELQHNGDLWYYCYYKKGVRNGFCKFFYNNGNVKSEMNMENGVIHGKMIEYYREGNIESISYYYQGERLEYVKYDKDKNIVACEELDENHPKKKYVEILKKSDEFFIEI